MKKKTAFILIVFLIPASSASTQYFEGFESGNYDDWIDLSQDCSDPDVNQDRSYEGSYSLDLYASAGTCTANRVVSKDGFALENGKTFRTYVNIYQYGSQGSMQLGLGTEQSTNTNITLVGSTWSEPYLELRVDGQESTVMQDEYPTDGWHKWEFKIENDKITATVGQNQQQMDLPEELKGEKVYFYSNTNGWGSGSNYGTAWDSYQVVDNSNGAPDKPRNPEPSDNQDAVETNTTLSVDVFDPDGDTMNVSFYDGNDELIAEDKNVSSGQEATVNWTGLETGTTYNWYAKTDDGEETNTSEEWSFTTVHKPQISNLRPANEEKNVSVNTELKADIGHPDDIDSDVAFRINDGTGWRTAGTDLNVSDGETATVNPDLDLNENYTWYAEATSGPYTTQSSQEKFKVESENLVLDIEYGNDTNYPPETAIIDVLPQANISNTIEHLRLLNQNQTVIDEVNGVEFDETVSLLYEGLEEDMKYNYTVEIDHYGEQIQRNGSFTTLTVEVELTEASDAEEYNIYRREGTQEEEATFDYGRGDYNYIGFSDTLRVIDSSESLTEGDFCYVATAENKGGESEPSDEECIEGVELQ